MMKRLALPAILTLIITGCASTPTSTVAMPKHKEISQPPIGSVNVASLGDNLLTQGRSTEQEALYFDTTQKFGLGMTAQGGYYPKNSENAEYVYFGISRANGGGRVLDLLGMEPPMSKVIAMRKSDKTICGINAFGGAVACKAIPHSIKNWQTTGSTAFQQTLLYNGKVGNKINIAYREFSSDTARPAFNNNVEYDLSESNQIGYKGAILEVIEANNQSIKYKVIKNFNTVE